METNLTASARPGRTAEFDLGGAAGAALVAAGVLLLALQTWGLATVDWRRGWPLAVLAVGLVLLVAAVLGDRRLIALVYPGSVVTTVGAILLVQNATGQWQTWAYAWALIAPTAVGAALWLHGLRAGREPMRRLGQRMAEGGLLLLAALAGFFELVLNLSGLLPHGAGATGLAVLLVLGGAYLLVCGRGPVRQ